MTNVKKAYAFSYCWMSIAIMPIIVPYFTSLGLSMRQFFELQAFFGITVAVLEVPSGYLCDLWGRKKTLCLGALLSASGFTFLIFANTYEHLMIFEFTLGTALSLISGADISIIYDSLKENSAEERSSFTKALGNLQLSKTGGEAFAGIIGGLLAALISFKATVYFNAVTAWFPLMIALSIKEPKYDKMGSKNHFKNFRIILVHIFGTSKLLALIFCNLVLWGLSTYIAVWIFQKHWQNAEITLGYFGILWAGYNLTVGITGKFVHRLEDKFGPLVLLLVLGILPVMAFFGMAWFTGWLGVVIGLLFQISRGITQVLLKDALNWRIPSEFRATANSLVSLVFRSTFALIGPLIGYLIDDEGLSSTLNYLGGAYVLIFVFLLLPLFWEVKKLKIKQIPA